MNIHTVSRLYSKVPNHNFEAEDVIEDDLNDEAENMRKSTKHLLMKHTHDCEHIECLFT